MRTRDRRFDDDLDTLTIAQAKAVLLGPRAAAWARRHGDALASEAIAALAKVMTNDELSSRRARALQSAWMATASPSAARAFRLPHPAEQSRRRRDRKFCFRSCEGLSYGCGDVIIGLNPAADDVDTIVRLEQLLEQVVRRLDLPTRYCVLSDIVKQHAARKHTRIDVGFQSLAGTSRSLAGMVGLDVDGRRRSRSRLRRPVLRDRPGIRGDQRRRRGHRHGHAGSAHVRARASHRGARRRSRWMIVNDVAGFIGPEVFTNAEQLERACLEDTVMAKLHGLTMGLDVCATFHMGIAPAALRRLTARIVDRAAPAYLMSVAGNADPMLGYLTTSFREHPRLRHQVGRRITSSMEQRLRALGAMGNDGEPQPTSGTVAHLYAAYAKAGGDRRSSSSIEDEGRRRLSELRERGFDLGVTDAIGSRRAESMPSMRTRAARSTPALTRRHPRREPSAAYASGRRPPVATTISRTRRPANGCDTRTRERSRRCTRAGSRRCRSSSRMD